MDWFGKTFSNSWLYNGYATTNGFGSKFETHNTGIEFDDVMDNVVADVDYVELESTPYLCNKCKYAKVSVKIESFKNLNGVENILCNYNGYQKVLSKTECKHFEMRDGIKDDIDKLSKM